MGEYNFKEETGDMQFDASGFLKVNIAAGGAGDGAVLDGVSSSIKATVLDLTASNPQAVAIVDSNGDQISSFGGGTQYTEDAAAAANPVGTAVNLIRQDTPASEVSGNGDNIAQRGTAYGAAYTQIVSSSGAFIDTFGGGTQYTQGDTDASITGTAMLMEGGADTLLPVQGTVADGLLVNLGANNDVVVSATNLDIRDIDAATDDITVHGDVGILDQLDLTNSNPAVVAIVDGNGDQITSFGGGTQYTEDAASAANPVGTAVNLIRADTPAGVVTTDGDNVAQRGTNFGAAYVQVVSSAGAFVDTFGGGTQYTQGDTDASITGTAILMEGAADTLLPVQGTVADGLLVNLGSNNDVTVTGTVDLGATDNAVLDAIAASVAAIDTDTTTIIGHLDGVEGLLGTIDADTGGILTSVQLIDDAAVVLGTATYTEATSTGLAVGAVRRDADTTLVNTTNEWGPLQMDANGRLKVEVFSGETLPISGTVDLGATDNAVLDAIAASVASIDTDTTTIIGHLDGVEGLLTTIDADTGGILTSVQLLDDAAVVLGTATYTEATSTGLALGAVRRDADTTLVNTTNEWGPLQMDANGRLKVEVFSGEALPVTMTSTTITGTVAVTQSGTWDEVGINDSGNSITIDNSTLAVVGGGAEATALRVTIASDSTGVLSIDDNGASITVDGTITETNSAAIAASLSVVDDWDNTASDGVSVSGDVAHDGIDAGEPVKVGYKAIAHGANPTAVAANDRTNGYANRHGIPWVMAGHPNIVTIRLNSTAANTDQAIVTVSAGTKIVVTRVSVTADNANTVDVAVRIGFGAVNTPTTTGVILSHPGIAPGSGVVEGTGSGILGVGADDEDLRITSEVPTTGSIDTVVSYYTIES